MPRKETRESIERALAAERRKRSMTRGDIERMQAQMERQFAEMRKLMDPERIAAMEARFRAAVHKVSIEMRRRRRRPGEGSMPALVEPPRGPKPLTGGAAAPLEFD